MTRLYTVPTFEKFIKKIAAKHGLDLTAETAHLRLDLEGYERLTIEKIGEHLVSVAHYYEQNGDLVSDPDIVFLTSPVYAGWIPVEITEPSIYLFGRDVGGYRRVAHLDDSGERIKEYYPKQQRDVASFCATWARNLKEQGWLEHGVKYERPAPASGGNEDWLRDAPGTRESEAAALKEATNV